MDAKSITELLGTTIQLEEYRQNYIKKLLNELTEEYKFMIERRYNEINPESNVYSRIVYNLKQDKANQKWGKPDEKKVALALEKKLQEKRQYIKEYEANYRTMSQIITDYDDEIKSIIISIFDYIGINPGNREINNIRIMYVLFSTGQISKLNEQAYQRIADVIYQNKTLAYLQTMNGKLDTIIQNQYSIMNRLDDIETSLEDTKEDFFSIMSAQKTANLRSSMDRLLLTSDVHDIKTTLAKKYNIS